jgi:hypothetical protein
MASSRSPWERLKASRANGSRSKRPKQKRILDCGLRIWDLGFGILDCRTQIVDINCRFHSRNLKYQIPKSAIYNLQSEIISTPVFQCPYLDNSQHLVPE